MKKYLFTLISAFVFVLAAFGQSLPVNANTHALKGFVPQAKYLASRSVPWMTPATEGKQVVFPSVSSFASKNLQFPLRTCLFFPYQGEISSTWAFFARPANERFRNACGDWLGNHNLNTLIFLMYNRDPRGPVSFFKGGYATDFDMAQAAILERWLKIGKDSGAALIPCMFCDEDEQTAHAGWDKHEYYFRYTLPFLSQYCTAILIGLESNECFSTADVERLIAIARKYTSLPIGTHMQWDRKSRLPAGLDWLAYEHSFPPNRGDSVSAAAVRAEAIDVINKSGLPVAFIEYNLNPTGSRIREQTRALETLPGCVMVGGPR
jgi:hypothetical protein